MRNQIGTQRMERTKHQLLNRKKTRVCNLCTEAFTPRTVFDRYCPRCKDGSEVFKFSEWLPELNEVIQENIPA